MAIYAEEKPSTNYAPAPAGNHFARCVQMIDMGTHANKFDATKPDQRKVRLTFELPTEQREFKDGDGLKPHLVSKKFTLTMHEKGSLRGFLQAWRGKDFTADEAKRFDVSVLLGKCCLLNIIHESKGEKTYANIASVSPLVKGMTEPAQLTPSLEFSLDRASFDEMVYDSLPDFLRTEIAESPEYQRLKTPAVTTASDGQAVPDANDNDVPF